MSYHNYWNTREKVFAEVEVDGFQLKNASDDLKDDKPLVMAAVKDNWKALEHASPRLQDDKEVVLEASKQNPKAIYWASENIQALVGDHDPAHFLTSHLLAERLNEQLSNIQPKQTQNRKMKI